MADDTVASRPRPACVRCRSFKKKCSRTLPQCALCRAAKQPCSYAGPDDAKARHGELKARIQWLTRYISENAPPEDQNGRKCSIEHIETGTSLKPPSLAPRRPSPSSAPSPDVLSSVAPDVFTPPAGSMVASGAPVGDELGRRCVDAFFRHVGRSYPCVGRDQIQSTLDALARGASQSSRDATASHLVTAIGHITLQSAGQVPSNADSFAVSYPAVVHDCCVHHDVLSVQTLTLLALYSLFDPTYSGTWTLVGMASRHLLHLGLTRTRRSERCERRNRLYWSIYILDRQMASSLGMPPTLADENTDIPLPGLTMDEFASPDRPRSAFTLQVSRHIIQLRQLEDRILRTVHLGRQTDTATLSFEARCALTADLRKEIENWYSQGWLLSPPTNHTATSTSSHTINWISARYYHLLLLLYYPTSYNLCASGNGRDPLVDPPDLIDYAVENARAMAALSQSNQLPLNRLTVCRLLPIALIFIYCYLPPQPTGPTAEADIHFTWADDSSSSAAFELYATRAREGIRLLIDMLRRFSPEWHSPRATAAVMRKFLLRVVDEGARPREQQQLHQPHQQHHLPKALQFWFPSASTLLSGPGTGSTNGSSSVASQILIARQCMRDLLGLMEECLGRSSSFRWALAEYAEADAAASSTFPSTPAGPNPRDIDDGLADRASHDVDITSSVPYPSALGDASIIRNVREISTVGAHLTAQSDTDTTLGNDLESLGCWNFDLL